MKKLLLTVLILSLVVTGPAFAAKKKIVLGKIPYTLEHSYHQSIVKMFEDYAMKMYGASTIIIDGQEQLSAQLKA